MDGSVTSAHSAMKVGADPLPSPCAKVELAPMAHKGVRCRLVLLVALTLAVTILPAPAAAQRPLERLVRVRGPGGVVQIGRLTEGFRVDVGQLAGGVIV